MTRTTKDTRGYNVIPFRRPALPYSSTSSRVTADQPSCRLADRMADALTFHAALTALTLAPINAGIRVLRK